MQTSPVASSLNPWTRFFLGMQRSLALCLSLLCILVQVAYEVAQGLAFLHANNIVHFDLKSGKGSLTLMLRCFTCA